MDTEPVTARRIHITIRSHENITRFTRKSARSLSRELRLLWHEHPHAKAIEIEIIT